MRRSVLVTCLIALALVGGFCLAVRIICGPFYPEPPPATKLQRPAKVQSPTFVEPRNPFGPWSRPTFIPYSQLTQSHPIPEVGFRDLPHSIAQSVATEMGRMLEVSVTALPKDADITSYVVSWGNQSTLVALGHHPWSAEDWTPLATALLAGKLPESGSDNNSEAATALLELTPANLLAIDSIIGQRLVLHPLDAAAHENAALIASVFSWRERAGNFTDQRDGLALACAHLAIARALGSSSGASGRVATALIEVVAGREVSAISLARSWPDDNVVLAAWRGAIVRSAGLDWRANKPGPESSLVERLAYARALAIRLNATAELDWLDSTTHPPLADWCRIACESPRQSVGDGHICALGALEEESDEDNTILRILLNRAPASGDLAILCNTLAPKTDQARVISPSLWGRFLARHLLAHIDAAHKFAADQWGVASAAAEVRELALRACNGLVLLPFLRAGWDDDPNRSEAAVTSDRILTEHPEFVPPGLWPRVQIAMYKLKLQTTSKAYPWLVAPAPPGTTWCIAGGSDALGNFWDLVPIWSAALELSPNHPWLAKALTLTCLKSGRDTIAQPVINRLRSIDYTLLSTAAYASTGDARITLLRDLTALDPDAWIDLGRFLAWEHRDAEAAEAYERGYSFARNSVLIANNMSWWVDWLLDHGQLPRAQTVANRCREVYSCAGLQTFARFCERTGDLDQAERTLNALNERYDDRLPLIGFYARTAANRAASKIQLEGEEHRLFPLGRSMVKIHDFSGKPGIGVVFSDPPTSLNKAGITADDRILAVDGVRCESPDQYEFLYGIHSGTPLHLICFKNGIFREVEIPDPYPPIPPVKQTGASSTVQTADSPIP